MPRLSILALSALAMSGATSAASPPGTCGPWVSQTNGTQWRMCVDLRNFEYCELRAGGVISRIQCP